MAIIFNFILLTLYVYNVVGFDSFFKKGQRAEIFELTDDVVPTFRITIPSDNFNKIKNYYKPSFISSIRYSLISFESEILQFISNVQYLNFTEIYPNLDLKEFPELNINENGFPNLDTDEILKGFKLNEYDYPDYIYRDNTENDFKLKVLQSNEKFDIMKILTTLASMTDFYDESKYNTITNDLVYYKFIKQVDNKYILDENYKVKFNEIIDIINDSEYLDRINDTNHSIKSIHLNLKRILYLLKQYNFSNLLSTIDFKIKYPELKINNDGYANFNIEDIMKGFNFYLKSYIDIDDDDKFRNIYFAILQSNQNFDLLNILIDLSNLIDFKNIKTDDELTRRLIYYKFIIKNDNNTYNFNMEYMVSFLKNYYNSEINDDDDSNDNNNENNNNNYNDNGGNDYDNDYENDNDNDFDNDYDDIDDDEIYIDNLYFDEDNSKYVLTSVNDKYYKKYSNDVELILNGSIKDILENILEFNFKENNLYFMKEEFPELKIGENGYSNFSVSDVHKAFKYRYNNYPSVDHKYNDDDIKLSVFQWNKDFRLVNILTTIANSINFKNNDNPNVFIKELAMFKFVKLDENNNFILDKESYDFFMDEWEMTENYENFKTKNCSMIIEMNGKEKMFKKVTFSVGGRFSRNFSKPQYNIKIRGKKDLFGRTQFKLRSDTLDPSYMKTKIISDVHNRLGIPSVSANYITLYINDEFMGLFILTDKYKLSWVEYVYGEKDSTSLYKCESSTLNYGESQCQNENESVKDTSEWDEFILNLDNAQSISDLENFFDVDQFLKEMALEYLFGSNEHIRSGHNYYIFKPKNGKWQYLIYDFDLDFKKLDENVSDYFENYENIHLVKILDLKNSSRFKNIVKEIVTEVFNPATLYPHIDHIKEFIRPYVIQDKTLTSFGYYPGRYNKFDEDFFTFEQWEANCEFGNIYDTIYDSTFGIKYWILERYRSVCDYYNIKLDPLYMDKNLDNSNNKIEKENENENDQISSLSKMDELENDIKDEQIKTTITLTKTITKIFTKTTNNLITPIHEKY